MSQFTQSLRSIEFVSWLAVCVPVFVVSITVLRALDAPTMVIFLSGVVFSELGNRTVDFFTQRFKRRQDQTIIEEELEVDG
jgi:hypothetical protein